MSTRTGYYYGDSVATKRKQNTVTASATLTASQLGEDFNIGTDALAMTLPLITAAMVDQGETYVFRNIGADGNNIITVSPNALDGINGSIANAAADSVASGTVNKDIVNTKATANKGDYIELKPVALTTWYIVGGVGIWASEA
jgi:hypothetical protein